MRDAPKRIAIWRSDAYGNQWRGHAKNAAEDETLYVPAAAADRLADALREALWVIDGAHRPAARGTIRAALAAYEEGNDTD